MSDRGQGASPRDREGVPTSQPPPLSGMLVRLHESSVCLAIQSAHTLPYAHSDVWKNEHLVIVHHSAGSARYIASTSRNIS